MGRPSIQKESIVKQSRSIAARAACILCCLAAAPGALAQGHDLEIITPHNEQIQQEFQQAFAAHVGRPLKVRWIKQGTGQLISLLEAQERSRKGASFDLDVFFGGGVPDHELAAQRGYLEKPHIPADILEGIPRDVAGIRNYDSNGLWYGSALSAFGILVNRRGLETQKLPRIAAWEDLAAPAMFTWVVLADPRKSSSVRVAYELVLQQHGWESGWPLLMRMAANARLIADSSSAIPNEIASGNVLAGPCIDFYARARVAQAGPDVLTYLNPVGGSAITPDPISMLRKPPHREMAERFIAFVLSRDGQRLWVLPAGAPGGPRQHALFRLAVRSDVYEAGAQAAVENPYEEAGRGVFRTLDDQLQSERSLLLAELMGATLVDLHDELRSAWKALIDGGMKPAALAEWNKVPFPVDQIPALSQKLAAGGREARGLTRDWQRQSQAKYQSVQRLAR
jgi:iron(III) transport system substrate-binding protein